MQALPSQSWALAVHSAKPPDTRGWSGPLTYTNGQFPWPGYLSPLTPAPQLVTPDDPYLPNTLHPDAIQVQRLTFTDPQPSSLAKTCNMFSSSHSPELLDV